MSRYSDDYTPKHSLSIKFLREIMPPRDLRDLMAKYTAAKKWRAEHCAECAGTGKVVEITRAAEQAWSPEEGTYIRDEERRAVDCDKCAGTGKKIKKQK